MKCLKHCRHSINLCGMSKWNACKLQEHLSKRSSRRKGCLSWSSEKEEKLGRRTEEGRTIQANACEKALSRCAQGTRELRRNLKLLPLVYSEIWPLLFLWSHPVVPHIFLTPVTLAALFLQQFATSFTPILPAPLLPTLGPLNLLLPAPIFKQLGLFCHLASDQHLK